jgi:hypothetical protein
MRRVGAYEILAPLGKGGMGTVYLALHTRLKRQVALKILPPHHLGDPVLVARFRREMEAVGKLDHPHLVRATDAGEEQGTHFLAMEFVEGLDLSRLVRLHGALPVADACELARQAAEGLHYVHEHGLVHRDVKPSNLMVTPLGQLKVLDLGLARLRGDHFAVEELTDTGQFMGTADYMAPEQTVDARGVDIRADLYSLGCTLYKLLTGRAPFSGPGYDSAYKKMRAHAEQPLPPVRDLRPEVPPGLAAVLDRLVAKDPAGRFATPAEAAAALAPFTAGTDLPRLVAGAWAGEQTAEARPEQAALAAAQTGPLDQQTAAATAAAPTPTWPAPSRPRPGRRRLLALAGGAVLLAALTAGGFWLAIHGLESTPPHDTPPGPPAVSVSLDELVPGQWHDLLSRPLTELPWHPDTPPARWNLRQPGPELWVFCKDENLVSLGETHAPRYEFEVGLEQVSLENVGLFFGYHDDRYQDKPCKKFQLVRLVSHPGKRADEAFSLQRTVVSVTPPAGGGNSLTMKSADVPWPAEGRHRLGVRVGPRGLEGVRWDETELPDLAAPAANDLFRAADYQGALGLYVARGTPVIHQARFLHAKGSSDVRPGG